MGLKHLSKYFSFKSFYFKFLEDDFLRCVGPPSPLNKQGLHAIFSSHSISPWVISWFHYLSDEIFTLSGLEKFSWRSQLLGLSFLFHCRYLSSQFLQETIFVNSFHIPHCQWIYLLHYCLGTTFVFLIMAHDDLIFSSGFLAAFYKKTCPGLKSHSNLSQLVENSKKKKKKLLNVLFLEWCNSWLLAQSFSSIAEEFTMAIKILCLTSMH